MEVLPNEKQSFSSYLFIFSIATIAWNENKLTQRIRKENFQNLAWKHCQMKNKDLVHCLFIFVVAIVEWAEKILTQGIRKYFFYNLAWTKNKLTHVESLKNKKRKFSEFN